MLESRRRYYFLAIAEHLNITKAAASLMIAQPSLTQYLNQLEKELDAKLIDRKYSPLRLTRAGQIYYDYLKDAQYKDQEMRAKIAAETAGERLPLRIGVPMQKSQNVTQTLLPQFTEAYPNVTFSIWEGTTTTVRNRVIQGEIDIGFGHTRIEGDQECDVLPLRTERVVIVCNRMNPVVGDAEASLALAAGVVVVLGLRLIEDEEIHIVVPHVGQLAVFRRKSLCIIHMSQSGIVGGEDKFHPLGAVGHSFFEAIFKILQQFSAGFHLFFGG